MGRCHYVLLCAFALSGSLLPTAAHAQATVELTLVMQRGFPQTRSREVMQTLGRVGFDRLQIRSERTGDRPSIEKRGTMATPRYFVTGMVTPRSEIILPGGTFSVRDRAGIEGWLEDLRSGGAGGAPKDGKSAFGLSASEFDAVMTDLSVRVTFETKGLTADDAIGQIGRKLRGSLRITPPAATAMRTDDKVRDELKGVSSGTALAAILRPAGCYFRPVREGGSIRYVVDVAAADSEPWPIGWPSSKDPRKLIPKLFDWLTVELADTSITEVLDAIRRRLKVPFLLDHNGIAINRINLDKIKYEQPSKRTYYYRVLSQMLFKARLKSEVRVDEDKQPFLWITTLR